MEINYDNSEFGTIQFEGKTLVFHSDAFLDESGEYYKAYLDDEDGDVYAKAIWQILDDYDSEDMDEADACNWDKFTVERV